MSDTSRQIRIHDGFVFGHDWADGEIAALGELVEALTRQFVVVCQVHSNPPKVRAPKQSKKGKKVEGPPPTDKYGVGFLVPTWWTQEQAVTIRDFLDDLSKGIWENYLKDPEKRLTTEEDVPF